MRRGTEGSFLLKVNREKALDMWAANIETEIIRKACGFSSCHQVRSFVEYARRCGDPRALRRAGPRLRKQVDVTAHAQPIRLSEQLGIEVTKKYIFNSASSATQEAPFVTVSLARVKGLEVDA